MLLQKYSFESKVWHTSEANTRGGEDLLLIEIRVYTKFEIVLSIDSPTNYGEPFLAREFTIDNLSRGKLLSDRSDYTWSMVDFLSAKINDHPPVSEDVRRSSIEQVFRVAEEDLVGRASSFSIIHLDIVETVLSLFDSAAAAYLDTEISSIKGLEKVSVDSCLGLEQGTPSCVICLDNLIDGGGKKQVKQPKRRSKRVAELQSRRTITKKPRPAKEEPPPRVITRLPCSHHFHGDCIVKWLENNQVCPLCRHQVGGQPSKP